MFSPVLDRLGGTRLQDLLLAALALVIVALMVLPLPGALLDALITANIGFSVLLLMLALYVRSPLALSTFPTLLLLSTLLRLSLNIASTRSILLQAHAGQIIDTFGRLVVGGSVVVGCVVFVIIAVVQFIVIAKGAERVAEVGARFTLDALPGKQLSIDAELRAGLIDRDTAQARRETLQRESHLYGAMDGAMKFVKGDAIAGLVIALVNLVAGISVGVALHGLPFGEAVSTYAVLTVGDGLVSQIPSLFVSMAAGLLITRVAGTRDGEYDGAPVASRRRTRHSGGAHAVAAHAAAAPVVAARATSAPEAPNLAREIGEQLLGQPQALVVTAVVLLAALAVPGFPKWPFAAGSAAFGLAGLAAARRRSPAASDRICLQAHIPRDGAPRAGEPADDPRLLIRLSSAFAGTLADGRLVARVEQARAAVAGQLGLPFPGAQLRVDESLPAAAFRIELDDVPVFDGAGETDEVGLALQQTLMRRAGALVGLQQTRELIDEVHRSDPELVAEALRLVPLNRAMQVLRRLLDEHVSIRNLRAVLHALVEWAPREKDPIVLTEHVRHALAPQITWQHGGGRPLLAIELALELEQSIRAAVTTTAAGSYLALEAPLQAAIAAEALKLAAAARRDDHPPACVLTAMDIRRYVRSLLEPFAPGLAVLSFQDLSADARITSAGVISPGVIGT